jgi:hypothetical protein
MKYLTTTDPLDAAKQAEALGRAYAQKISTPYPMPPDFYGPGRQPEPREAYYQRFWVAPQPDPSVAKPDASTPLVIPVDATVLTLDKVAVTLGDSSVVVIDVSKAIEIVPAVVAVVDVTPG